MNSLEAYVCGSDGRVVGDSVEISLTGFENTFRDVDLGKFPLVGKISAYNKNTEFTAEFLEDLEAELGGLLLERRHDGISTSTLTSLLSLVSQAKHAMRPVKFRFVDGGV